MNFAVSAVLLFSAATTALFGWAVYRGDTSLVAGYDSDRVNDEAGLARFVGRWVLSAFVTTTLPLVGGYVAFTLAITGWPVVGTRRFED
ncbi:hypothetical protein [Halomarina litorea]|uniref:hypothetical protein n=1 Tax=Halomarina litorea TaxID=2961595 RepID=UPI0020C291C1|nr:hypothetical protein [Halomarina sp. BCD28]